MTCTITQVATKIAGCIFEEADGTLADRLSHAIEWQNRGIDGDLSHGDRESLRLLLNAVEGIPSDLCDSYTGEMIRDATESESIEAAENETSGDICVDGRACFVTSC
jgi:hypothetical protein